MVLLVSTCCSEWLSDAWLLSCLLPHKILREPCGSDAGELELFCAWLWEGRQMFYKLNQQYSKSS